MLVVQLEQVVHVTCLDFIENTFNFIENHCKTFLEAEWLYILRALLVISSNKIVDTCCRCRVR